MENQKNKLKRVEIVTPVYNRRDITLQCIKSLNRINLDGLDVHIIVVDDGSNDGTYESIAQEYPDVRVIKGDGSLWFTGGTNLGIKTALEYNLDYVMTINDDSVFDANFLRFMIECLDENPHSIIGPLLLLWDTPHKIFQVSPKWSTLEGGFRHWVKQTVWTVPEKPWEVEIIVGNCILFPVGAIKENGLMDRKKFPHFGDAEYTPRMKKNGWKLLIEPRARVYCQPNNLPPSVQTMSLKKMWHTLFIDLGNANSMRRRLNANLAGAPNRLHGIIAFIAFYLRYIFGKNIEGVWTETVDEKPLKETFADKVVS